MRISDWSSDVCSSDLIDEQVAGLDVAVHQSGAMSSLQGRCGFGNDLQGALVAQTTGTSQHLGQRVPRDVLHHQISDAPAGFVVFLTEVEDRDDRSAEHTSELKSLMRI